MTFGEQIRAARKAKGLSYSQLSEQAKISRTFLYQIEHDGSVPTIPLAASLARVLDVSLDRLAGLEVQGPSKSSPCPTPIDQQTLHVRSVALLAAAIHIGAHAAADPQGFIEATEVMESAELFEDWLLRPVAEVEA